MSNSSLTPLPRLPLPTIPPLSPVKGNQLTLPSVKTVPSLAPEISPIKTIPSVVPTVEAKDNQLTLPSVLQTATLHPIKTQPTLQIPLSHKPLDKLPVIKLPPPPIIVPSPVIPSVVKLPSMVIPPAIIPSVQPPSLSTKQIPIIEKQYIRELQFASLSGNRIIRTEPPPVVTHLSENRIIKKEELPKEIPKEIESCCVCYEDVTYPLVCKHSICGDCAVNLQAPECPVCKKFLEGKVVTDEKLATILSRQDQAKQKELYANYLASVYLQENPDANQEEIYQLYQNQDN